MKKQLFGFLKTNRKGLALISVLGVVTLATILILALFSVSDAEFKAAKNYSDGATARHLADSAVNLVISQIQAGATGAGVAGSQAVATRTTWASQPGAIRVYRTSGEFVQGRRLYSSDRMVINETGPGGETTMAKDALAADWNTKPAEWVDLNEPVIKVATGGGAPRVVFPIVDPKAARAGNGMEAIEGFSYSSRLLTNSDLAGVVTTGELDDLRLPMPVRWLYVLKDGTMGTVSSTTGSEARWESVQGAGTPSELNPIIGRMAFWTDDECSRININTAGEPGQFATPTVFNIRDGAWANNQPVWREYQRYPGHPATVALSSVLYPNPTHDQTKYDGDGYSGSSLAHSTQVIQLKAALSSLAPRLGRGASADGTIPYAPDDFISTASPTIDALKAEQEQVLRKHLYASIDEWIFANWQTSDSSRDLILANGPTGPLITPNVLERGRFFLTAHSKASELNMFGLPRVAIWPVPDADLGPNFRTGFDSSIAYASSLGSTLKDVGGISTNSYYFSRRDANSGIEDLGGGTQSNGLVRNKNLMSYLDFLVSVPKMPGGGSFRTKYGEDDSRQILVQIFDYIRTTNLYDAFLDDLYVKQKGNKRDLWDDGNAANAKKYTRQQDLWLQRPAEFSYYTYTAPRFDTIRRVGDLGGIVPVEFRDKYEEKQMTTGAYPGHGQVRPIEWSFGGKTYKGFGRFPTISEVALQFICTGDGKNDQGSFSVPGPGGEPIRSGGKTAQKIDPTVESPANERTGLSTVVGNDGRPQPAFWYSNLPPFPSAKLFEKWGMNMAQANTGGVLDPVRHPGINPMNWNCTLDWNANTGGIELKENEKRIQIVMQLELFVPAVGYTKYVPDFTIVLDGKELGNFQVESLNESGATVLKSIFNTTGDQVVQSTTAYFGSALGEAVTSTNVTPMGGSYGTTPLMSGRQAKSIGKMPQDPSYNTSATGDAHSAMLNFPLVSSYFTVDRTKNIKFKAPKSPLKIDIYASHDWRGKDSKKNTTPTQTVFLTFDDGEVPAPWLVVHSSEYWKFVDNNGNLFERRSVHAPRWWSFNTGGALQRYEGVGIVSGSAINWSGVKEHVYAEGKELDTRGRFAGTGHTLTQTKKTDGSVVNVPSQLQLFGYSPLANFRGVKSNPQKDLVNADVFQPAGLQGNGKLGMGDYGFWGSDSVRSMMPSHGDYRILAARAQVPATVWRKHRVWQERPNDLFAHSLMGAQSNLEAGVDVGNSATDPLDSNQNPVPVATNRLVSAWYPENQVPDTPLTAEARAISAGRGDFDNGMGDIRDGAYINKADDGNLSVDQEWYGSIKEFKTTRNSYFKSSFLQIPSKGSYFTPNRMLSSPVVLGSLPTGVFGSGATTPDQQTNGVPWRTLLFRSDPALTHYGNGIVSPADHNFLDLFWMPIIEPYAVSDSFATAGKVNMNYQMVPFTHIQRKTAMHAVLKGELVTAFSQNDVRTGAPGQNNTIIYKRFKDANTAPPQLWGEGDVMQWHRKVNIEQTLNQFDERFAMGTARTGTLPGLFRTASQICELDILPRTAQPRVAKGEPTIGIYKNDSARRAAMTAFWNYNKLTGDNTRERTYSNIYQKLTTRSNSYRVYFMAQAIKKAKSVSPDMVNMNKDTVTGEYRGSALIDRFLDFSAAERGTASARFPNYADGTSPFSKDSLETFYHFRILEMKQFSP